MAKKVKKSEENLDKITMAPSPDSEFHINDNDMYWMPYSKEVAREFTESGKKTILQFDNLLSIL